MNDVEITFMLPKELVERALKVGLVLEEKIVEILESEVHKREGARHSLDLTGQSGSSLSQSKPVAERGQAELQLLSNFCREKLELATFGLSEEYGYASLPLCVIDTVYSIGVKYELTQNTVKRFCAYADIPRLKTDSKEISQEFSISDLLKHYRMYSAEELASTVYQNRQRTSSRNGILKAEAVGLVAEVLQKFDVDILGDVEKISGQADFEYAFRTVPGQGSGVSLRYFYMLTGSVEHIKPDRMIIRFISDALHRNVEVEECHPLLVDVCRELAVDFPDLTPRALDNVIWQHQRTQPQMG